MYFPITIIDNFYKNFFEVEKFAKNIDYFDKTKFNMLTFDLILIILSLIDNQ